MAQDTHQMGKLSRLLLYTWAPIEQPCKIRATSNPPSRPSFAKTTSKNNFDQTASKTTTLHKRADNGGVMSVTLMDRRSTHAGPVGGLRERNLKSASRMLSKTASHEDSISTSARDGIWRNKKWKTKLSSQCPERISVLTEGRTLVQKARHMKSPGVSLWKRRILEPGTSRFRRRRLVEGDESPNTRPSCSNSAKNIGMKGSGGKEQQPTLWMHKFLSWGAEWGVEKDGGRGVERLPIRRAGYSEGKVLQMMKMDAFQRGQQGKETLSVCNGNPHRSNAGEKICQKVVGGTVPSDAERMTVFNVSTPSSSTAEDRCKEQRANPSRCHGKREEYSRTPLVRAEIKEGPRGSGRHTSGAAGILTRHQPKRKEKWTQHLSAVTDSGNDLKPQIYARSTIHDRQANLRTHNIADANTDRTMGLTYAHNDKNK
ncbi:hypothetical protein DFH09DRAFT_1085543 [Mycena vulgaris]|nr:hypothetical protein DFH09DRAFT_1085543 [Mycena vulgaris]